LEAEGEKLQDPNPKEAPNTKIQAPEKLQFPISNLHPGLWIAFKSHGNLLTLPTAQIEVD
jgi:hypothetical protein